MEVRTLDFAIKTQMLKYFKEKSEILFLTNPSDDTRFRFYAKNIGIDKVPSRIHKLLVCRSYDEATYMFEEDL